MKLSKAVLIKQLTASAALALAFSAQADVIDELPGFYQGACEYQAVGSSTIETIPMTIEVNPVAANEVTWTMHYYRESGDIVKNYSLKALDSATGHYAIDENNGIVIDLYKMQQGLVSHFEAAKRQQTMIIEQAGDQLTYTSYAFGTKVNSRTRASGVTALTYAEPSVESCVLFR